jgi:two-component system sensor histidine kinase/response regulator
MMQLTCMRHLKADRLIVVHPYDMNISSQLITDKHWLSENVLCLLSNAVKYSDDGPIDLRITIINVDITDKMPLSHMVHVSVEDSGIGISEDKRNALFQPFMQAQRHAGGTGLGLFSLLKR